MAKRTYLLDLLCVFLINTRELNTVVVRTIDNARNFLANILIVICLLHKTHDIVLL